MMMTTMIDRLTCCNCFVNSEMKLLQNHFHLQHLGISVQPALIGSPADGKKLSGPKMVVSSLSAHVPKQGLKYQPILLYQSISAVSAMACH